MSTKQKRNSRFSKLAVPLICSLLLGYFIYHAVTGRFGTEALGRLDIETTQLEFELASLVLERQQLEARVLLLHDGTLEQDMLDEEARKTLNLLGPNEVAILKVGGRRPRTFGTSND